MDKVLLPYSVPTWFYGLPSTMFFIDEASIRKVGPRQVVAREMRLHREQEEQQHNEVFWIYYDCSKRASSWLSSATDRPKKLNGYENGTPGADLVAFVCRGR